MFSAMLIPFAFQRYVSQTFHNIKYNIKFDFHTLAQIFTMITFYISVGRTVISFSDGKLLRFHKYRQRSASP